MKNLFIENIPYRELMITGYGLVYSRGREDSDWKKKITRENFLNSQNFALSKFFLLFFCSWSSLTDSAYEESWGSIYRRGFGLEILLNLQSWKSLKSITWNPAGYWSLQRENLFSLSKTCYFPILHVGCKVVESRQILLFTTIHDFWYDFWCSVHAGVQVYFSK